MSRDVKPWHHYRRDLRDPLAEDDLPAFRAAMRDALSGDNVIRDHDAWMLIDGNVPGRAYNAMGQSTLGLAMIEAGEKWDKPAWIQGGIAALNVMLVDYDAGGLGLNDPEAGTAWFVGKTNRVGDSVGATLNKHLYAARTLLDAAAVLERTGHRHWADRFAEAGAAGYLKMVTGDVGPMLEDYFVRDAEGGLVETSWIYYSLQDADPERPYFVGIDELNAHYHIFVMELIQQVGDRLDTWFGDGFDWRPYHEASLDGMTPFGAALQIYENKLADGGLGADSRTEFGQFTRAPHGPSDAPYGKVLEFLTPFLDGPVLVGGDGADVLRGTNLDERIYGKPGDDRIEGGAGDDTIRGGRGEDTLLGGSGKDKLVGGTGDDLLAGGGASDVLIGGAGSDLFAFQRKGGIDRVVDYEAGERLAVDDRFLEGTSRIQLRALDDPSIFALDEATEAGHRIVYDTATGVLWFDPDGTGEAAARKLAVIEGAPVLDAEDIWLF